MVRECAKQGGSRETLSSRARLSRARPIQLLGGVIRWGPGERGVRGAGDLSSWNSPDRKTDALRRFRTGCERASPIEARDACGARQGTVGGLALFRAARLWLEAGASQGRQANQAAPGSCVRGRMLGFRELSFITHNHLRLSLHSSSLVRSTRR